MVQFLIGAHSRMFWWAVNGISLRRQERSTMYRRKIVHFVKEQGISKPESESEVEDTPLQTLSGTEAREFYEDVLAMPEESKRRRIKRKRRRVAAAKGAQTSTQAKTVPTVSQVFGYVQEGDLGKLQTALSSGACDVNTTDQFNWTLLMSAAHAGHAHIVEHLLSAGAEWRERVDRSGCTAVDLALRAGHTTLASLIETYTEPTITRNGDDTERRQGRESTAYFCEKCQQRVTDSPAQRHTTSTLHQFSCQHSIRSPHTSYVIPRTNRGYQLMLKSGWDPEKGLGCDKEGRKYPVKTVLKQDRLGFGQTDERLTQGRPKVTHFAAFDERAVRRRSERIERGRYLRKRDIVAAARKDRDWEVRMRRYMNTERDIS